MPHTQLYKLADVLLRGGIAPRHVWRYVTELSDHYDDAVKAARDRGVPHTQAARDALARIGAPEDLARAMLAREDLKSFAARYPAVAFGVLPLLGFALGIFLCVLALMSVIVIFKPDGGGPATFPEWLKAPAQVWLFITIYGLPLLAAAGVAVLGLRQRINPRWLFLGICSVGFVGGFHDVSIVWPASPGAPGSLNAGLGLFPPFPQFGHGLIRAGLNILLVAVPTWVLLRRQAAYA